MKRFRHFADTVSVYFLMNSISSASGGGRYSEKFVSRQRQCNLVFKQNILLSDKISAFDPNIKHIAYTAAAQLSHPDQPNRFLIQINWQN